MNSGKIEFSASFLCPSVLRPSVVQCEGRGSERTEGRKEGEGRRKEGPCHAYESGERIGGQDDGRTDDDGMCGEGGAETSSGEPKK